MSTLDLDALGRLVDRPDDQWHARVREHLARAFPSGTLGRLGDLAVWLGGVQQACPTRPVLRPRVVVFAGDHGIAQAGVTVHRSPAETGRAVRALLDGGGAANVLARRFGATIRVVDVGVDEDLADVPEEVVRHKVRRGSGRIDRQDALSGTEAEQAFRAGAEIADAEVDAGADLFVVGNVGAAADTAASALIGAVLGVNAATVTGRGDGIDDATWMRKCAAIRDAMRRARPALGDPLRLLTVSGGAEIAAITGFLVQASIRRTPVLLDGVVPSAGGLVAQRIAYPAPEWWRAGHLSPDPAHAKALERMMLSPLLDYGMSLDAGTGALVALPLVQAAADLLSDISL